MENAKISSSEEEQKHTQPGKEHREEKNEPTAPISSIVLNENGEEVIITPRGGVKNYVFAPVNNSTHAASIIKTMRSRSHAQKCYQRLACDDNIIVESIFEFNSLVNQSAQEAMVHNKIDSLIENYSQTSQQSSVTTKKNPPPIRFDDFSSDEDDDDDKNKKKGDNQQQVKSRQKPPQQHQETLLNTTISINNNKSKNDSDDDVFLSDLDDEDEKAELFKGFVPPKITGVNNTKNKTHGRSATADLEYSPQRQHKSAVSLHRGGEEDDDSTILTYDTNMRTSVDTMSIPAKQQPAQVNTKKSHVSKESPSVMSAGNNSINTSTSSLTGSSHHKVMFTPGQRIRVRPSGRKKTES